MRRRTFLTAVPVSVAFSGAVWHEAVASVSAGTSPYGPLGAPDANGMALPAGFTGRVVARTGRGVGGTLWHPAPDGGACFADGAGWIYVSNSEVPLIGGASAIRFRADGSIERAYRILSGTNLNCAGGATPGTPGCRARRSSAAGSTRPTRTACARPSPAPPWAASSTRRPPATPTAG
ncbi:hypothetical protein ACFQ0B_13695 [Nonomuraea thailandensis]